MEDDRIARLERGQLHRSPAQSLDALVVAWPVRVHELTANVVEPGAPLGERPLVRARSELQPAAAFTAGDRGQRHPDADLVGVRLDAFADGIVAVPMAAGLVGLLAVEGVEVVVSS